MTVSKRVELRVEASELERWNQAAGQSGFSLSEWIRQCCSNTLLTEIENRVAKLEGQIGELRMDVLRLDRNS